MTTSFTDLRLFCLYLANKYGSLDAVSEEQKADEFRSVYMRKLPPNLKTLRAVAASCGINLSSLEQSKMPKNVRGYHEVFDGYRSIYFKQGDTLSGIENTILHEIREMMEPMFVEACPGYEPLRTLAVHLSANRFASAVLMPRATFEKRVYQSGLDIISLASLYQKSCSQTLIRMGEVLQGKLFLYGALYEPISDSRPELMVTYWTRSWNEESPEANVHGVDHLFPKKGHWVLPGSLVDNTICGKRSHLVNHITILDEEDDDGLTAIAQPLMFNKATPAKVALVVTLLQNKKLLQPQIDRTNPIIIYSFHHHL